MIECKERKLKEQAAVHKERMTESRYREIESAMQRIRLHGPEMLAWIDIHETLNTFGDNHIFAAESPA